MKNREKEDRPTVAQAGLWYKDGLRFQCQRCGNCCRGETGYVWTTPGEIKNIVLYLGLQAEEFARKYLKRIGYRFSLKELSGGDCVMYKAGGGPGGCQIYPVRPKQCSTFPFWPDNLKSYEAWASLKKYCNGVDKGPLYPLSAIQQISRGQASVGATRPPEADRPTPPHLSP
ncbi:MAG TPA: YkgJ family cysteine cluster protein [Candidatus Tripitaka sp. YC43]